MGDLQFRRYGGEGYHVLLPCSDDGWRRRRRRRRRKDGWMAGEDGFFASCTCMNSLCLLCFLASPSAPVMAFPYQSPAHLPSIVASGVATSFPLS